MRTNCSSLSYLWLSCLYSSYTIILFFIIQYATWFFLYSTELVFIVLTVYLFLSYDDSFVDSLILIQVYLMYYTWLISFYPLIFILSRNINYHTMYLIFSILFLLFSNTLSLFYCLYLQVYLCYFSFSPSHSYTSKYELL